MGAPRCTRQPVRRAQCLSTRHQRCERLGLTLAVKGCSEDFCGTAVVDAGELVLAASATETGEKRSETGEAGGGAAAGTTGAARPGKGAMVGGGRTGERRLSQRDVALKRTWTATAFESQGRPHVAGKLSSSSTSWVGRGRKVASGMGRRSRKDWRCEEKIDVSKPHTTDTVVLGGVMQARAITA